MLNSRGRQQSQNKKSEEVGRAEFNVATPTYANVAYSAQRTVIHKQNSFKITSNGFKVEP